MYALCPPPSPAPADRDRRRDPTCVWPRGFGWKDAPSLAELASLLLSLTQWPLLHMADSGIPLKRKVRLLLLCSEPDPDSSQCLQVRPQHALLPPPHLYLLLPLSSFLTLPQPLRRPLCSPGTPLPRCFPVSFLASRRALLSFLFSVRPA